MEAAVRFYEKFGFVRAISDGLRLVLMMATIAELLPGTAVTLPKEGTQG